MPSEGIRSLNVGATCEPDTSFQITVRGRTVRIHLVGILDRQDASRLIRTVSTTILDGRYRVVLDAHRLGHLDYRSVAMLMQWNRGLVSLGHQLVLENWSPYLKAILAMEDWDGELERGSLGPGWRPMETQQAYVQAP